MILSVNAPDSGAAEEELAVAYGDERLEIGFNAKYLLEIASQVDRENAVFLFNSSGDPTLMREGNDTSRGLCRHADAGVTSVGLATIRAGSIFGKMKRHGGMSGLYLSSLTLSHFRSHRRAKLELDARPVAIYGPNGAGKTNILEAVSLFSPGRGLRRASAPRT